MFLPPDHRPPQPPPREFPPPKRALSKRGEVVMLWMVCLFLLLMLLAPLGGSTLVEAIWFMLSRERHASHASLVLASVMACSF